MSCLDSLTHPTLGREILHLIFMQRCFVQQMN